MKRLIPLILWPLMVCGSLWAENPDLLYKKATDAYKSKMWFNARDFCYKLTEVPRRDSLAGECLIIYAASHYREGSADKADAALANYHTLFPQGKYRAYAYLYQALFNIRKGTYSLAADQLLTCIQSAQTSVAMRLCEDNLSLLLQKKVLDPTVQNTIQSKLPQYSRLYQKKSGASTHKPVLAILVPLSGGYNEIGSHLVQGILYGLEKQLGPSPSWNFEAQILDTKGSPIYTVELLKKTFEENQVIAIIGPALSEVSLATALYITGNHPGVPMITPSATAFGISTLGPSIFQTNVPTKILGETLARYTSRCLNIHEVAILSPETDYGLDLENSFRNTFEKNGGNVMTAKHYVSGEEDYAPMFNQFRRELAQPLMLRNSGEPWVRRFAPSPRELSQILSDSVLELPAMFIAAPNAIEARTLLSQARYNKLRTRFLGSSGWQDHDVLRQYGQEMQGTIFSAEYSLSDSNTYYQSFKAGYTKRWGFSPNKVAALGYDAALFFAEGYRKNSSPAKLANALSEIRELPASRGMLVMNTDRYNQSSVVLEIKGRTPSVATCPNP